MLSGVTPEIIELLRSNTPIHVFDLYTFDLLNGETLRYTTAERNLVVGGETYLSTILFERSSIQIKSGLEVDEMNLTVYADDSDLIGGIAFHDWLRRGGLDGAYVTLHRAYYTEVSLPPFLLILRFCGRQSPIVFGGLKAEITVRSDLELLDRPMPRNLYQSSCGHTLYDQGCGVLKADYLDEGAVLAGSTTRLIRTDLTAAAGYYDLGLIKFTSGALLGTIRTIKAQAADGGVTVIPPLIVAPAAGDTIQTWPGCDHSLTTCDGKFSNKARFRGQPYIPVPETAR